MADWINQMVKNARLEVYMLHADHNNSAEILWKNRCNSVLHHNFYHNNCLTIAAMDIIIK